MGLLQDLDLTGVDGLGGLSTMVVDVEKRNVRGEVGEDGDAGGKGACRGDSKTGLARGCGMFNGWIGGSMVRIDALSSTEYSDTDAQSENESFLDMRIVSESELA